MIGLPYDGHLQRYSEEQEGECENADATTSICTHVEDEQARTEWDAGQDGYDPRDALVRSEREPIGPTRNQPIVLDPQFTK